MTRTRARTRQFRVRGRNLPFRLFGIGWNRDRIDRAAQDIRNYGYYARVVPRGFDKDIHTQRYGIFIRGKRIPGDRNPWHLYPQDRQARTAMQLSLIHI